MSIILKGIDLPEKENRMYMMELYADGHCSVAKVEDGECYELTIPSETEAIQIPTPHGRIIDGDKLCKDFENDCSGECDCCIHETENYNCGLIANAPTILEAEE